LSHCARASCMPIVMAIAIASSTRISLPEPIACPNYASPFG
jgi:hypothetical protein